MSAQTVPLSLGRYRVLAPDPWRSIAATELHREVRAFAVPLAVQSAEAPPQTSLALLERTATGAVEAEVERIAAALVAAVRGARAFAPERFDFSDGTRGRRVTVRLPISETESTVQTHVVQIRGELLLHLVASTATSDHPKLSQEIDAILCSFEPIAD